MPGIRAVRLLRNPLGQPAPDGQRGDIVRVSDEWATIYLDPNEFDRTSEAGLRRLLSQADPRPTSDVSAGTPAGGRGTSIHNPASRGAANHRQHDHSRPAPRIALRTTR